MADLLRIDIDNGKYTVVQPDDGMTYILRYGEPWLGKYNEGFPGTNAVLAMAYELEELRKFKADALSGKPFSIELKEVSLVDLPANPDGIGPSIIRLLQPCTCSGQKPSPLCKRHGDATYENSKENGGG